MSETWVDIMKRELRFYNDDWADDDELIDAITDIIEEFEGRRAAP